MQRSREPLIFGVTFVALSMLIGWVFWASTGVLGEYDLNRSMLAVPVVSAMIAAIGFAWRRKAVYVSVTLGLYVLARVVAELAGLDDLAARELNTFGGFPSLVTMLYLAFLSTFPLAMLVLFVGRTPSLLWSKRID